MKKNLRLLCLGLAAATFTCGFAQENKTSLLENSGMEEGLKGWVVGGKQIVGKNTKNLSTQTGFYGMGQGVLEAWNGSGAGLANSYIMQRVGNGELPNGTYVFGAYVGASKQYHRKPVKVTVDGKEVTKYEYWSNRDSVQGVQLFANDAVVRVATNNPDYNNMVSVDGRYTDGHSAKFNVAVTLTDEAKRKGTLDLGLRYMNTNANYVVWDNATLYYFGDMSEADALDAMAEIDMDNAVAVADTLVDAEKNLVMHVDTLKNLKAVIASIKEGKTTAATLWEDSEELFWSMALARRSITDYANLKTSIEFAQNVSKGTWRPTFAVRHEINLRTAISNAEEAYDAANADRDAVTELRQELVKNAGFLRLDSVYIALDALNAFYNDGTLFNDAVGGYTTDQKKILEALYFEASDSVSKVIDPKNANPRPQDLYPYIERIYAEMEEVKNNPYDGEWMKLLPQSSTKVNGYNPVDGTEFVDSIKNYVYVSPLIGFDQKRDVVRLTVTTAASNNQIYFCISSLEFFDEAGNEIPLEASNFYSNADHNTVSGSTDGQSYAGLVDDDPATYFHSDWSGKVTEPHYLEVTLPNGYEAVTFKMVSRAENQRHQFPGEIIVTTPAPQYGLAEVQKALTDAQALYPYSGTDAGLYVKEFPTLLAAMRQAEAILDNYTSEEDCNNVVKALRAEIDAFNEADPADKIYNMPVAGKTYRFISAAPYYDNQGVEKALTIRGDSALCWETVCADSLMQEFVLEEILDADGELGYDMEYVKDDNGNITAEYPRYFYRLKSAKSGLYVEADTVKQSTPVKLRLVEETKDTIRLKCLGAGQWNIITKGSGATQLHTGGHNGGAGKNGNIVGWNEGIGSGSAWFIREMPEMPLDVLVKNGEFKSECYHFDATNIVTLTADKACAFDGLTLYDLYGSVIAIDSLVVSGQTATIVQKNNIVACAFAFNNAEGVASVKFDAKVPMLQKLQEAYDNVMASPLIEGDEVGQYSDLADYNAVIATAEGLLENGGSDEDMKKSIEALNGIKANLTPNMPVAGEVYSIYSALSFEEKVGIRMSIFSADESYLRWGGDNVLNLNQYWSFEPATAEELEEAGAAADAKGYFIKNLAYDKYIGELLSSEGNTTALVDGKEDALIYTISVVNGGCAVNINVLGGNNGQYFHANAHSSGSGKGANVIYYYGAESTASASAWYIESVGDAYLNADKDFDNQIIPSDSSDDIEFVEVGTVVKGIYDLFGRRVDTPSAPGIYIIDGVKKVIK